MRLRRPNRVANVAPFYEYGVYLTFSLGNRLWYSLRIVVNPELPRSWSDMPGLMLPMLSWVMRRTFCCDHPPMGQDRTGNGFYGSGCPKSDIMFLNGNRGQNVSFIWASHYYCDNYICVSLFGKFLKYPLRMSFGIV